MSCRLSSCALPGLVLCLLAASIVPAQMNGTYTIDPSKPPSSLNFQSFAAATSALKSNGIGGAVTFRVAPVTYQECLTLRYISGISASAMVSFLGDGGVATLTAPVGDPRYCIDLESVSWFRFENLKLTGYLQCGLHLDDVRDSVFRYCEVDDGYNLWPSILAAEARGVSDRNTFERCIFRGTGQHLCIIGGANTFDGCEFDGQGKAGILLTSTTGLVANCFFHDGLDGGKPFRVERDTIFAHNTVIVDSSGTALDVAGSSTTWAQVPIVKNNVLINMGSGSTIVYPIETSRLYLYPVESDYNCHFAPNSSRMIMVGYFTQPYFAGSLDDFRTWQKAVSGRIQPGGATLCEGASRASDPGFVSRVKPYDIHLRRGSPLLDQGTSVLTPAYTQYGDVRIDHDFEGDLRIQPVDIGSDEVSYSLGARGTGGIGTVMQFDLSAQFDAGLRYQLGTALGSGPIFIGNRTLALNLDGLLLMSIGGMVPGVFQDYGGVLDSGGKATARLAILNESVLKGIKLYTAFVTIRFGAPQNIESISNTHIFTIQ